MSDPFSLPLAGFMAAVAIVSFVTLRWIAKKVEAEPCPRCGSRWWTEEWDEWEGKACWHCRTCYHYWLIPNGDTTNDPPSDA